jgi:hypothetical protein
MLKNQEKNDGNTSKNNEPLEDEFNNASHDYLKMIRVFQSVYRFPVAELAV